MIIPSIHTVEGVAVGLLIGSFIPNPLRVLKAAIVKIASAFKSKVVAETQVLDKKL